MLKKVANQDVATSAKDAAKVPPISPTTRRAGDVLGATDEVANQDVAAATVPPADRRTEDLLNEFIILNDSGAPSQLAVMSLSVC